MSNLLNTLVIRASAENPSSTVAIGEVSEMGLKTFSTDFGGVTNAFTKYSKTCTLLAFNYKIE